MILIEDHTDANLDELAMQHYQNLIGVPNIKKGIYNNLYHADNSLIGRIEKQKYQDYIDINLEQDEKNKRILFWNYLLDNEYKNLKDLIVCRPLILKPLMNKIDDEFGADFFSIDIDNNNARASVFGNVILAVFNYNSLYRAKEHCVKFIRQFNLKYCPYCNENAVPIITRTNNLTGNRREMALLQLDHFYPQSRVPYFALSFFNLIPGCSNCNKDLKHEKKFDIETHINPFHKRFDEYFKFEVINLVVENNEDIEFTYSNIKKHSPNSIIDFEIIERYNASYKKPIFNLIETFGNNSPKILENLKSQFLNCFGGVNMVDLLLINSGVPQKISEINSLHIGKLKRDIAIQLELLRR